MPSTITVRFHFVSRSVVAKRSTSDLLAHHFCSGIIIENRNIEEECLQTQRNVAVFEKLVSQNAGLFEFNKNVETRYFGGVC